MYPAIQKRTPDLIIDGSEPPCGFWELNSGPLEEKPVFLTSKLSLQPVFTDFQERLISVINRLSDPEVRQILTEFLAFENVNLECKR